jgi:hypothetical protein
MPQLRWSDTEIETELSRLARAWEGWNTSFGELVVYYEPNYTTLEWHDAGVGEDYILNSCKREWRERDIDIEAMGGCDTCGYGRLVTLTISGKIPPW